MRGRQRPGTETRVCLPHYVDLECVAQLSTVSGQPHSMYGLRYASLGPVAMTATHRSSLVTRDASHTEPPRPPNTFKLFPEQTHWRGNVPGTV